VFKPLLKCNKSFHTSIFFCFVKTEESHVIVKVSTKDKFHFNLDEAQKTNCVTMSWEDICLEIRMLRDASLYSFSYSFAQRALHDQHEKRPSSLFFFHLQLKFTVVE
jgi:hypothetical protein